MTGQTPTQIIDRKRLADAMVAAFRAVALRNWPDMDPEGWPAYIEGTGTRAECLVVTAIVEELAAEYERQS